MIWSWLFFASLLAAWFIQNCLHELSHLIFAWLFEGLKPKGFWPYPHFYKGRFFFARYKTRKIETVNKGRHIAPFWSGLVFVWAFSVVVFFADNETKIYYLAFVITNTIDALFFWWGYIWGSEFSDGKRFRHG